MLGAYMYVFLYLTFSFLRRPVWLELYYYHIFNKVTYLTSKKRTFFKTKKFLPKI
jgi:hypothetical protein